MNSTPDKSAAAAAGPDFDEAFYLATYPDVAAAVASGTFASGRAHFDTCGRAEGRLGANTRAAALLADAARCVEAHAAGRAFTTLPVWAGGLAAPAAVAPPSDLQKFVDARREGRGIWKWQHYLEVYERHFARFRGREVHVLEIGVYSGGSLDMWREYFGPQARIYGADIEPACQVYAGGAVRIFTGDQTDRAFWRRFRAEVPVLDIVIDDGGHLYDQQRITLEELLPHVRAGGVYLCEDVHTENNSFGAFAAGLAAMLNAGEVTNDREDVARRLACRTSPFQSAIHSVSFYPQIVVIEKNPAPVAELVAPKRGTQWQPFLQ
ncbi:MAG TPA: class I SAM-dependent methyltransferase [Lacunisphaera sp.]|nr:class I SAM-dependent methyltransferase [Lacunisphaera sp.]